MRRTEKRNTENRPVKRRLAAKAVFTALLLTTVLLDGCNRTRLPVNTADYVEIDNPINEGNPAESAKIWVPKSSLEKGVPRASADAAKLKPGDFVELEK